MWGSRTLFYLGCFLLLLSLTGCKHTGLEGLRSWMKGYGYTLYEPPRTNHGPGWTFRMVKTYDGKTVPMTVCDNLYPKVKVKKANVNLPDSKKGSGYDVDFAVALLEGLIDNIGEAKANLKSKGTKSVNITWGAVHTEALLPQQTFDPSGKKLEVDSTCAAHLSDLKDKGTFADSIFMVQQAIIVDEMNYKVSANSETGGGLSISLKEVLTVKPEAKVTETSENLLVVKEPRYLGFRAFLVNDVVPTGLLGPETAIVSGRLLSDDEVSKLLGNQ